MRCLLSSAIIGVVIASCCNAQNQPKDEIAFTFPGGLKVPLAQLVPEFENTSGYKVARAERSGTNAHLQALRGDGFDVIIVEPPYTEVLASGNVVAESATPIASVSLGVAVRQGAPKPDISNAAAVKRTLLAAKTVSIPTPATGSETGLGFLESIRKLGIADEMQPKIRPEPGGKYETVLVVARGEVEVGITFISEMNVPGIDIVGTLPEDVFSPVAMVGFISSHAKDPAAARALLDFISAPHAEDVYKASRIQPTQEQITLIAPGGARAPVEELIPGFERRTGHKVKATFGSGNGTKRQVVNGEAVDVPIVQPPYPEVLASGNVVVESATPLASVAIGIAVRKGAPRPDVSTPEALKRTLLAAKSVAYPNPAGGGAAGAAFEEVLKKLGISDPMQPKLVRAQGGAGAMAMVAKGEAEIGFSFLSEMNEPGADLAGLVPKDLSPPTSLVGFVSAHAKDPATAHVLLEYLSSPEAAAVYKRLRMEPAR